MFVMSSTLSHCKNKTSNETLLTESRTYAQWPAKGFASQIPNLRALNLQNLLRWKKNIFDCSEIFVLKAYFRRHARGKASRRPLKTLKTL